MLCDKLHMNKILLQNYDLNMTLLGGQSFNFDFDGEYYWGFTQDKVMKLKKEGDKLHWQTYPEENNLNFLKDYLRLDVDYHEILKKIQKDNHVKAAIRKYPNLRLLNQDFEQTLLSFLISPNNNIKSIRKIIRALSERFGKQVDINGKKIYLFPKTEVIAGTKIEDLLGCKLGFRAKFIKAAAGYLIKKDLLTKIKELSEQDARSSLIEINGVGNKIADCVLVFSLGFDNVTPLDVWGKRVLTRFYGISPKTNYSEMQNWINNYFEGYAGWAGQFLYEYIRNTHI